MGMAGGAYQGDMDRERLALQAAQVANQARATNANIASKEAQLQAQQDKMALANERANRAMDIREQKMNANYDAAMARIDQQNAVLQERMRNNDMMDARGNRGLDIREQLAAARQRANYERLAGLERQNGILGQMQQVCDTEKRQTKARKEQGQSTVASMMKMGLMNGGTVPMAALNMANRQLGFDGRNQAIGGAGFTQNGDFYIDFLQRDPQSGGIARNTQVTKAEQLGRIMYGQAGIFDNNDRAQWRDSMLKRKYSDQEVNAMSGLDATAVEGLDEIGLRRLAAGFADPSTGSDWKRDIAYAKLELQRKALEDKAKNGQSDKATEYALRNFSRFGGNAYVPATQEDVDAGRVKKVGDPVPNLITDDERIELARNAYERYREKAGQEEPETPQEAGGADEAPQETPEAEGDAQADTAQANDGEGAQQGELNLDYVGGGTPEKSEPKTMAGGAAGVTSEDEEEEKAKKSDPFARWRIK